MVSSGTQRIYNGSHWSGEGSSHRPRLCIWHRIEVIRLERCANIVSGKVEFQRQDNSRSIPGEPVVYGPWVSSCMGLYLCRIRGRVHLCLFMLVGSLLLPLHAIPMSILHLRKKKKCLT
ncbi:hypothetical protein HanRHA438_Chr11g0528081 [Helianthus annuus]|nr:hypothetical protein HanRHA438_Chr11g0528081 [Helianthus annuus]